MINLKQNTKTIETDFLNVKGNLISWQDTIIQISNITLISTSIDKQPFPWLSIVFLLGSFAFMNVSSVVGYGLLIIAIAMIALWYKKSQKLKSQKKLNFMLNSGGIFTLVFHDKKFLDEVLEVLTEILTTSSRKEYYTINNKNNTIQQNCNNKIENATVSDGSSLLNASLDS